MAKFGMVTHVGRGMFLGGQPHLHPRGKSPASLNFLAPLIFATPIWYEKHFTKFYMIKLDEMKVLQD